MLSKRTWANIYIYREGVKNRHTHSHIWKLATLERARCKTSHYYCRIAEFNCTFTPFRSVLIPHTQCFFLTNFNLFTCGEQTINQTPKKSTHTPRIHIPKPNGRSLPVHLIWTVLKANSTLNSCEWQCNFCHSNSFSTRSTIQRQQKQQQPQQPHQQQ